MSLPRRLYQTAAKQAKNTPQFISTATHFTDYADLRSDTVTQPCAKMRDAAANAVLGDDTFGDCPTTNKFESDMAALLGKEAAVLTPTGTQANLIAMMLMAPFLGSSVLLSEKSHILDVEKGGISALARIVPKSIPMAENGEMDLVALEGAIPKYDKLNVVPVVGIAMETPTYEMGRVVKPEYLDKIAKLAKKYKLRTHIDGARLWNAASYLEIDLKDAAAQGDTVSVCMSKGLGCPAGSILAGSEKDIRQAREFRKMLGG